MTAFRVMGVTRGLAYERAKKYLAENDTKPDAVSWPDWRAGFKGRLDSKTGQLYASMKAVSLSELDAPIYAEQYVETAKATSGLKDWHIEYRHPCGVDPKTNKLRYEWRRWNGRIPELTPTELGEVPLL